MIPRTITIDLMKKNNSLIQQAFIDRYISANKEIFIEKIEDFFLSGQYILGPNVDKFETEFSRFTKTKFCIGVADGTRALEFSIRAASKRNPIIFLPSHTAIATAMAVNSVVPDDMMVFVDMADDHFNMSAKDLESQIQSNADLIAQNENESICIFVPIYGSLKGVEEVRNVCKKHNIKLIIDSAQAHGAYFEKPNKIISHYSDISSYSFYPTKNLPALGDAGAIVTNNPSYYEKCMLYREYGWKKNMRNISHIKGYNSRLDEIQAIFLNIGLLSLHERNNRRTEIANEYLKLFSNKQNRISHYHHGCVFHQFVIETENREAFIKEALSQKISLGIHYPLHVIQNKSFSSKKRKLKNADSAVLKIVSLPISPELTQKELIYCLEKISKIYEQFN